MIASVNLDVSIVNVTNESEAGRRRKGRESRVRKRERDACTERMEEGGQRKKTRMRKIALFLVTAR